MSGNFTRMEPVKELLVGVLHFFYDNQSVNKYKLVFGDQELELAGRVVWDASQRAEDGSYLRHKDSATM